MHFPQQLSTLLLTHAIHQLQPGESRVLASDKTITYPNYYADLRLLTTLPEALPMLVDKIFNRLPDNTRYVGAVPTGGLTMLGALGYFVAGFDSIREPATKTGIRLFYVRKDKKDHGQGKQVEGYLGADGEAVMLEDVVTSAGSLIKAIQAARAETGATITTAICVLDREMGGAEALAAIGVTLIPIFTATQLGLKQA